MAIDRESGFFGAMSAGGWLAALTLFGEIPYWVHEKSGVVIVEWRDWQREYAVSGLTPPPF